MRILHVIDSGGLYGAEVTVLHLMNQQKKLGLSPILASIGEKGIPEKPIENEARKKGLKVKSFRMLPGPNLIGAMEIIRFARRERIQILHSHGYKSNILFASIPRRIRNLPLLTTLHGWTSSGGLGKLTFYEWLDSHSLQFMDAVVLVSEAMRSHPRLQTCDSARIHVVPNGLPVENSVMSTGLQRSCAQLRAENEHDPAIVNFCTQGFTIGSIGRLSREKGYDVLLEAFRLLVERGLDIRLIIVGEGPERRSLENRTQSLGSEINSRILLPGYQSNARKYLQYFGVFVLPSHTEGTPITLLEAMYEGVPIVATRVGGVPQLLDYGELGILVKPSSPDELATAISRVMENGEMKWRIIQRAKAMVREHYSSVSMAIKYKSIYSTLTRKS